MGRLSPRVVEHLYQNKKKRFNRDINAIKWIFCITRNKVSYPPARNVQNRRRRAFYSRSIIVTIVNLPESS